MLSLKNTFHSKIYCVNFQIIRQPYLITSHPKKYLYKNSKMAALTAPRSVNKAKFLFNLMLTTEEWILLYSTEYDFFYLQKLIV